MMLMHSAHSQGVKHTVLTPSALQVILQSGIRAATAGKAECMQCAAGGLPLLDKYFYAQDPYLVAGGCLGMGIVSARTQTEHDPAYALLYEYVEKVGGICPEPFGSMAYDHISWLPGCQSADALKPSCMSCRRAARYPDAQGTQSGAASYVCIHMQVSPVTPCGSCAIQSQRLHGGHLHPFWHLCASTLSPSDHFRHNTW